MPKAKQRIGTARIEPGLYRGQHQGVTFTVRRQNGSWWVDSDQFNHATEARTKVEAVNAAVDRIEQESSMGVFPRMPIRPAAQFGPDAPDGIYLDVPPDQYHDHDAFSRSFMATFLDCPARAWHEHQKEEEEESEAMDFGDLFHMRVLEPERYEQEFVTKPDECDDDGCTYSPRDCFRRGNDVTWLCGHHSPPATAGWERHEDVKALTEEDASNIEEMHANVTANDRVGPLIRSSPGLREATLLVTHPPTGLRLRARPDLITPNPDGPGFIMLDLKSHGGKVHPSKVKKAIGRNGVFLQDTFYSMCWNMLASDLDVDEPVEWMVGEFIYVFVEKSPPHLVGPHALDRDLGQAVYRRLSDALDRLSNCVAADVWPGYPWRNEVTEVDLPPWTRREFGISS